MAKTYSGYGLVADGGVGTTGGAVADLPRDGVSYLTANEIYTLAPPTKGCQKKLVYVSSTTSAGGTVWAATSSGAITFNKAGHGKITFAAATTEYQVVDLIGVSSVQWAVANLYPVASSGAGPATTTF